jgi:MFS family permease
MNDHVLSESRPALALDESLLSSSALKVLLGAGVGMFLNAASLLVYTFGVFVRPIASQSGWSRTYLASTIGPTTLVIGLLCPFAGRFLDRYGAHRFACVSVPLLSLGLILLGTVPFNGASFAATFILAGVLGAGQTPVAYTYLVSQWFDAHRGLALGITLAFTGLGIAIMPPLAAALIATQGWRTAYVLLGVLVVVVGLPAAIWLVRDPPRRWQGPISQSGDSLRLAVASRPFWILLSAFFLMATATGAGIVPFPMLLADRGIDPQRAAFIMSVIGIAMIVGRLISGALFDRIFAPLLTAVIFAAPMLGHILLANTSSKPLAIAAAILLGGALGAEADALAYLTSRLFGMRHFGKLFGITFCVFTAGTALGSAGLPALAMYFGGYALANWLSAGCAGVAAILIATIRRPDLRFARTRNGS